MFEHVDAQRIVRVCEEAWLAEQHRESRRDGGTGVAFFGFGFRLKFCFVGLHFIQTNLRTKIPAQTGKIWQIFHPALYLKTLVLLDV